MPNTFKMKTDTLIALRKAKGYSQEKMGELLLMERSNYGKIERGETELSLKMAYEIAAVLDIKVGDFVNMPTTVNGDSENEAVILKEKQHVY